MAASSDSLVDFIEDTEEGEESSFLNRRHQELVRKLQSKKQTGTGLPGGFLRDPKKNISPLTQPKPKSSCLPTKVSRSSATLPSPGITMTMESPEPRDFSTIEASSRSLVQDCDQHSYKTEMFCKDCRVLVCAICFLFGAHKGHGGADIEETRSGLVWAKINFHYTFHLCREIVSRLEREGMKCFIMLTIKEYAIVITFYNL